MRRNEITNCIQKDKRKKCANCEYLLSCNKLFTIEEKIRKKRLEEEKRINKCFSCVWSNKEDMYCPFPKCIEEK